MAKRDMWQRIKGWFTGSSGSTDPGSTDSDNGYRAGSGPGDPTKVGMRAPRPDLANLEPAWIEADANPFGVRLLDVRPVTLGTLSMSQNPVCASNAVSYGGEDGSSFITQPLRSARRVEATLRYRAPRHLPDGALFIPREMEDKWALFLFQQTLLLVRSWQRQVFLRAEVRVAGDEVILGPCTGAVANDGETDAYTLAALDFIVRSHALRMLWPAPILSQGLPERALALECMSLYGRQAHYACAQPPQAQIPERPLRTTSRLHFAAMANDDAAVRAALDAGIPIDAEDAFGFTAIHFAKADGQVLEVLLSRGAQIDQETSEGATALMVATQSRDLPLVQALLRRGARADRVDQRGFSALHRAAEMGELAIAQALLAAGADPAQEAQDGHTPRKLAALRGEQAMVDLLQRS